MTNAWLSLETPKAAVTILLSGKMGVTAGFFASRQQEAEAQADLLRRLAFALWVGERNQYVGALQGMLIDRLVAAFKFGSAAGDGAASVRWIVQVRKTRVMHVHLYASAPLLYCSSNLLLVHSRRRRSVGLLDRAGGLYMCTHTHELLYCSAAHSWIEDANTSSTSVD